MADELEVPILTSGPLQVTEQEFVANLVVARRASSLARSGRGGSARGNGA